MNTPKIIIDIDKIADLSMLKLTADEKEDFSKDMSSIIGFANSLCELECDEGHALYGEVNVFREDHTVLGINRDELLANAKTKIDGYITVPRIIES